MRTNITPSKYEEIKGSLIRRAIDKGMPDPTGYEVAKTMCEMTNLFTTGKFELHSGGTSMFKIDCDALSDDDIESIAGIISRKIKFGEVIGIPNGGLRLATALEKYKTRESKAVLVVDDVLTTGNSFEKFSSNYNLEEGKYLIGFVLFARGQCPSWVFPVFELNKNFFRDI